MAEAKQTLGSTIPWIVDTMDNDLKHAMGNRPNSEFIVDPQGRIVRMRDWSSAEAVRADLKELVGPVENPTDPRSLNLSVAADRPEVARGVVKRVEKPGRMTALRVDTHSAEHPAYVKLRAEGDADVRRGNGRVYLGFFVDPIHRVHWNNLSGAVQISVNGADHSGPVVKAEADADPREFLIDVSGDDPIEVTLHYVACDDEQTWCRKLTQKFTVHREADSDAGRPINRSSRGPSRRPRGNQ